MDFEVQNITNRAYIYFQGAMKQIDICFLLFLSFAKNEFNEGYIKIVLIIGIIFIIMINFVVAEFYILFFDILFFYIISFLFI